MTDDVSYRSVNTSVSLVQPEDCSGDGEQEMNIKTISNGIENFIRISTELWSISDKEEWVELWDNHIQPMLDFEKEYERG